MRNIFRKILLPTLVFIFMVISPFFISCEIDQGLGVVTSRIRGRVILPDMSLRPDYFEAVTVIALTKQLDEDITLSDLVFSSLLVDLENPNPSYDLPAPLSKYELIAAVWKHGQRSWDYTKFFGFHGFDPDSSKLTYQPIYLTKEHPIVDGIDIVCDWIFVSE